MKEALSPKVGPVNRRPKLKVLSSEQQVEYRGKNDQEGDSLRRMVETRRVTRVTRLAKIQYRPVRDCLAPIWRHGGNIHGKNSTG